MTAGDIILLPGVGSQIVNPCRCGEVGLGESELPDSWSRTVGSPFPYQQAMRVVAIESDSELVEETAQTLAILARSLGGRTLGLFTSLARMRETADRLTLLLAGEGIEILLPLLKLFAFGTTNGVQFAFD